MRVLRIAKLILKSLLPSVSTQQQFYNLYVQVTVHRFQLGNGLKQGEGLAPNLFNIALEYVIRQLLVQVTSTIFYKSVQIIGYADDINIMGRTKRAISEVYGELKQRAKEVGLNINTE